MTASFLRCAKYTDFEKRIIRKEKKSLFFSLSFSSLFPLNFQKSQKRNNLKSPCDHFLNNDLFPWLFFGLEEKRKGREKREREKEREEREKRELSRSE